MDKKERIIISALELLVEKGIHNTPMSAIAKNAGTGMGTIYHYFPNKEALINAIYKYIKNKETGLFSDFKTQEPIKTQFENYFTSIICFFNKNPLYFRFMEQMQASPIITENNRNRYKETLYNVIQLLEKGQKERIIKNIEIKELLIFISGSILSYLRYYFNENTTLKNSLQNQIQLVWDAIKA